MYVIVYSNNNELFKLLQVVEIIVMIDERLGWFLRGWGYLGLLGRDVCIVVCFFIEVYVIYLCNSCFWFEF